jgi:hypothetical protein
MMHENLSQGTFFFELRISCLANRNINLSNVKSNIGFAGTLKSKIHLNISANHIKLIVGKIQRFLVIK